MGKSFSQILLNSKRSNPNPNVTDHLILKPVLITKSCTLILLTHDSQMSPNLDLAICVKLLTHLFSAKLDVRYGTPRGFAGCADDFFLDKTPH